MAMAIGIAMTMAIICFQDGFNSEMTRVMVDQRLGHIQINHPDYPGRRSLHDVMSGVDARVAALEADETVSSWTGQTSATDRTGTTCRNASGHSDARAALTADRFRPV